MSTYHYDVIVIGTGVSGQTAAEELAMAGKHVLVIERREIGGTCALRGCEPKKVLFSVAEAAERARAQRGNGLLGDVSLDWGELVAFKRTFTDPAPSAIEAALRDSGATVLHGTARFCDSHTVVVDGVERTARHFIIATGSVPRRLGIPGAELMLSSEQFMAAEKIGQRIVFVGGGYVSFEFAHIAAAAGSRVTIVHAGERVLEGFDPQLAEALAEGYRTAGIEVRTSAGVTGIEAAGDARAVLLGDGSRIECDTVVHGAGRVPDLEALDLTAGGVECGPQGVAVDDHMRSVSNSRVWAAGDAAALGLPLTPVGIAQARVIVRGILCDRRARFDPAAVPSVVFSYPPLASIGLTEEQAAEEGTAVDVRYSDTGSWTSSRRMGVRVGGAKVLIARESGRIVGAHLLGPHADEMINVFAAAMAGGLTAEQLRAMIWAYPTAGSEIGYLL